MRTDVWRWTERLLHRLDLGLLLDLDSDILSDLEGSSSTTLIVQLKSVLHLTLGEAAATHRARDGQAEHGM